MTSIFTIDASVFLNAFNPHEKGHEISNQLLSHLQELSAPLIEPTLILPEVAAAISRGRRNASLAQVFSAALTRLPHLMLIPLDVTLAKQASDIASNHHLRGSNAVYAAVAQRFGSTLVTLDREQRERVAAAVATRFPTEVLNEMAKK